MVRCRILVTLLLALTAVAAVRGTTTDRFSRPIAVAAQADHVLNRLAYGPRPGDVAYVKRIGVERWIRTQIDSRGVPQTAVLDGRLRPLESLRLPTWQLLEKYQAPLAPPRATLEQLLPPAQTAKLLSGTPEEKRTILAGLTEKLKPQVLIALPPSAMKDLSDIQAEAFNARRADDERRRRLRPPLMDLLTQDQMQILLSGMDDQKTQLLAAFDAEKRAQVLRAAPVAALPLALRREAMAVNGSGQLPLVELIDAKVYRALYSTRQLEEVLVDFWLNHFNVFSGKGQVRMLLTSYERDAIRPHVLGRFRDMVLATARHPAMLFYLDNWQSQAQRPGGGSGLNENYGRELMELHTLGVDGGYSQADVVNVARAFTGWTIHEPTRYGEFFFNPAMHDRDEKVVLGHTLPRGGGEDDGMKVIDLLSRHPSTAKFVARKLAQRFVADVPPAALVDRVAATFARTDGDLRAVTASLLLSKEFLSEGAWRSKVKSPMELVFSALRTLDADVTDTTALAQRITDLGQPLYGKSEPTGYPNTSEMWISSASIIARIGFATAVTSGKVPGVTVRRDAMPGGDPQRAAVLIASPDFQQR
jgi:uncharacterized protein (DUF1800 family)